MKETKEKFISMRVPFSLYQQIVAAADEELISVSGFIRRTIRWYLKNECYKQDEASIGFLAH